MIFSDRDIKKMIEQGNITVEPSLTKEQMQPAWIDLTLSNEFRIFKHTDAACIDPKEDNHYTETIKIDGDKPFILHPGEFVLGAVNEYIKLPADVVGAVDGRSSLGRLGVVVHLTSTFVNPGWGGKLVLEITNAGKMPVKIYPGMRICKFVFFQMTSAAEEPYDKKEGSKYNEQKGVDASKYSEEFNNESQNK